LAHVLVFTLVTDQNALPKFVVVHAVMASHASRQLMPSTAQIQQLVLVSTVVMAQTAHQKFVAVPAVMAAHACRLLMQLTAHLVCSSVMAQIAEALPAHLVTTSAMVLPKYSMVPMHTQMMAHLPALILNRIQTWLMTSGTTTQQPAQVL
jgi:hypothetical protein